MAQILGLMSYRFTLSICALGIFDMPRDSPWKRFWKQWLGLPYYSTLVLSVTIILSIVFYYIRHFLYFCYFFWTALNYFSLSQGSYWKQPLYLWVRGKLCVHSTHSTLWDYTRYVVVCIIGTKSDYFLLWNLGNCLLSQNCIMNISMCYTTSRSLS